MSESLSLKINERTIVVRSGTSVASAILIALGPIVRRSVSGEPRGPLCGMGVCFECRATIDGRSHRRTCQVLCKNGMEILTDA